MGLWSHGPVVTHLPAGAGLWWAGLEFQEAAGGSPPAAGTPAQHRGDMAQVAAERQKGKESPGDGGSWRRGQLALTPFFQGCSPASVAHPQPWGNVLVVQ